MRIAVGTLPSMAVLQGDGLWLTSTMVSLAVVLVLGVLSAVFIYAGRYFHWLTHAEQLRLSRTFRVAFGALFLAAALLPYLLAKAPLLAVTSISLGLVALIPILLTRPERDVGSPDDRLKPKG